MFGGGVDICALDDGVLLRVTEGLAGFGFFVIVTRVLSCGTTQRIAYARPETSRRLGAKGQMPIQHTYTHACSQTNPW
jgi:hypothetical protein